MERKLGEPGKIKMPFWKPNIAAKFLLWFLLVALLPLSIIGYVNYRIAEQALKQQVFDSLAAIAESRIKQFEDYISGKEKEAATLARTPTIIDALGKFNKAFEEGGIASPVYKFLDEELRPFLTYYKEAFGFSDLFLISSNGDAVFSIMRGKDLGTNYYTGPYKDSELAKAFDRAKTLLDAEISDFKHYPPAGEPAGFIAAPVFGKGEVVGISIYDYETRKKRPGAPGERPLGDETGISVAAPGAGGEVYGLVQEPRGSVIGIVAFQMDKEDIYALARDYTGLGETGETIIAAVEDNAAVFISPVRHDPDAAFKRRVIIGSKEAVPIQEAVKGKKGGGVSVDYRGREVLAVWRFLPHLRLGVVVKIDAKEAFCSVFDLKRRSIDIGIVTTLAALFLALLVSRSISGPITKLTRMTKLIASGILTAKLDVELEDEIGQLADSFNKMMEDLKRARDELEKHASELEKVNKELDSFVYIASHDLQAPLRGIGSFARFLEEDYKDKLDAEGRDYVAEIRKGAERMDSMIKDLRALSQISRIKNPYEDADINKLVASVVEKLKFDIEEYDVDLKVQKNMPVVYCDRIKIDAVFLNLLNNAIKFSSKIKQNPCIEIGYMDEKRYHKFFVKDNGIGIDPQYHEWIFGVFQRLHTEKEYKGTGTGLSIIKRIVDQHGGRIWVESEPEKGAAFYFTIPKDLKTRRWKKIGEILIENGSITPQKLDETLKRQREQG